MKKLMQFKLLQTGIWGRGLQPQKVIGNFLEIFVILAILMPFGSRFARF